MVQGEEEEEAAAAGEDETAAVRGVLGGDIIIIIIRPVAVTCDAVWRIPQRVAEAVVPVDRAGGSATRRWIWCWAAVVAHRPSLRMTTLDRRLQMRSWMRPSELKTEYKEFDGVRTGTGIWGV